MVDARTATVGTEMYHSLRRNQNNSAVVDVGSNKSVSCGDVLQSSAKLAMWLRGNGCQTNQVVAVCSDNRVDYFNPILACLFEGFIATPINSQYSQIELVHSLRLVRPTIVFCAKEFYPKLLTLHLATRIPFVKKIILLETVDQLVAEMDISNYKPRSFNGQEQIAAYLFSSGTTGPAKASILTHANILSHLESCESDLSTVDAMAYSSSMGLLRSLGMLFNGKTLLCQKTFEPETYLRAISQYRCNSLIVTPKMVTTLINTNGDNFDLSSLKVIVNTGRGLSKEMHVALQNKFRVGQILNFYHLTECTKVLTAAGKPRQGVSLKIRDAATGQTLGPNKIGELCVKSKGTMREYFDNENSTREVFCKDGWLLTGDLAYCDQEGNVAIVDRLMELIRFRDQLIAPMELESILLRHPKIRDAVVVGMPCNTDGERPLAFIVKKDEVDMIEAEVEMYIDGQVSAAKRLSGGIKFIDKIRRDAKGKVLRNEMKAIALRHKM